MMNLEEMRAVLATVRCRDFLFQIHEEEGYIYLQGQYGERDVDTGMPDVQKTRKWLLSPHMVKSEIVQTALKCVLTSAEHRVREHFRYRGELVFGPHFDVDALYELAKAKRLEVRPDPNT